MGKQAGAAVSNKVKDIWGSLRGEVDKKEAAKEAAEEVARSPEDADALGSLRIQLRKLLEADPALAADLAPRIEAARTEMTAINQVQARDQAVAAGRDAHVTYHYTTTVAPSSPPPLTDRTDPAALRRDYLTRLMEQVGVLSLAGIDPAAAGKEGGARFRLDTVYTALRTLSATEVPVDPVSMRLDLKAARRLSVLERLNRYPRLVLLGDPGSGKSTFVHFVALCHAGEILGQPINLDLLRSPLPQKKPCDSKKKLEPQPWDHGPLLPVRVVLRDFAARGLPPPGERVTARHLQEFLERELKDDCLGEYDLFKDLRETGGLLLFDGLDEVPEADSRRDRICQAVEAFVRAFGKCRVLVTSRIYAYRSQGWQLSGFAETELAPFDEAQIRFFVESWYGQVASTGRLGAGDARGRAELLLHAIWGSSRLQELAERPLLLTLMASLHTWRGGSLPEKREELYADAVDLLLNLWESQRVVRDQGKTLLEQPSLTQYLDVGKDRVRQVLEKLAFEVHQKGELAGTADIPQAALVDGLMALKRGADPVELMEYLSQRAGLLVPRGVGVYAFPHRTFQEYLAACHLTGQGFPKLVAELGREDPQRWREVALLAGAKAARGAMFAVWSLADCLCPGEPTPESRPSDVWGAHLAGQVIAESADLANLDASERSKLERLQRWHVHLLRTDALPAPERALAGKSLAQLGDPRFDPEHGYLLREPLLGFVEIPAGKFLMGESDSLHEVELPRFFISRFPVTVAQYGAFVASTGYEADPRCLSGMANHPVVFVTWKDALAYCAWLQERLGEWSRMEGDWEVTLPSEPEWEKAARGVDGRMFPWGEDADPEKANYDETGVSGINTIGCFPLGVSPFGCEEMSGNVWEWTWGITKDYPYVEDDGREDLMEYPEIFWVLRGGSCGYSSWEVRCAGHGWYDPALQPWPLGFRIVLRPSSSDLL
jgi:formylglycine-generating enzyme required for sulfatase activity